MDNICPYCETEQQFEDTEEALYITCECPGNVIVQVKMSESKPKEEPAYLTEIRARMIASVEEFHAWARERKKNKEG